MDLTTQVMYFRPQAVSVPITFIKGLEDFDTLFEGFTMLDRNRDKYIE